MIIHDLARLILRDAPSDAQYPLPAFYFRLEFADSGGKSDTSFKEVSGMGPEMDTEELVEGGENRFVHRLPKAVKHPKLTVKRGIEKMDSPLVVWCTKVLEEFNTPIKTQLLHVHLLNEKGEPARSWSFANAFPVKWEVESFDSTKNEVAIEKIEFSYNYSNREK